MPVEQVRLEVVVDVDQATGKISRFSRVTEQGARKAGRAMERAGKKAEVMARRGRTSFRKLATNAQHAQNPLAGVGAGVSAVDNSLALLGTRGPSQIATVTSALGALIGSGLGPLSLALVAATGAASLLFAAFNKEGLEAFNLTTERAKSLNRELLRLNARMKLLRRGVRDVSDEFVDLFAIRGEFTKLNREGVGFLDTVRAIAIELPFQRDFARIFDVDSLTTQGEQLERVSVALNKVLKARLELEAIEKRSEQEFLGFPDAERRDRARREQIQRTLDEFIGQGAPISVLPILDPAAQALKDAANAFDPEQEAAIKRIDKALKAIQDERHAAERELTRIRAAGIAKLRDDEQALHEFRRDLLDAEIEKRNEALQIAEEEAADFRASITGDFTGALEGSLSNVLRNPDESALEAFAVAFERAAADGLARALVRASGFERGFDSFLQGIGFGVDAPTTSSLGGASRLGNQTGVDLTTVIGRTDLSSTSIVGKRGTGDQRFVLIADFSGEADRVAANVTERGAQTIMLRAAGQGSGVFAGSNRSRRR